MYRQSVRDTYHLKAHLNVKNPYLLCPWGVQVASSKLSINMGTLHCNLSEFPSKEHSVWQLFIDLQAETWYGKAAEFWPSKATSGTTSSSSMLSPDSNRDLQQYEDRLSRFLVKFAPPSPKELLFLEAFLDKVPDTQQRNQAKLLTHRCRELEKIIRAREINVEEFGRGRQGTENKRSAYGNGGASRFENFYRLFCWHGRKI